MNELDPRVKHVWRLWGLVAGIIVTAGSALLELLILDPEGIRLFAPGAFTGSVALVSLSLAILWPPLRYRYWRWHVQADRVLIQKGVIWRSRSLIPRVRIQHVDTRSSPLQRWFGLNSLVIYTAGTRGADAEIPGLEVAQAEELREELAHLDELDDRD